MKTIGLIGGMLWQSTAEYYRIINGEVRDRLGGSHSAQILLYSFDFETIRQNMKSGDYVKVGDMLAIASGKLMDAGAGFIVLCANSAHMWAEMLSEMGVPLLHIAEATAAEVKRHRIIKVGLLGTRYTMEQPFIRNRLEKEGLQMILPGEAERDQVHRMIYDDLSSGKSGIKQTRLLHQIISGLEREGAEGIILGCTELPLLARQELSGVPLFNTTLIHARAAVEFALE
ncbi:MAG: amino acid racemase [Bacteroidales bacterium]|nr:amino acid racemase [Bacteroidales bacterium]